MNVPATTEFAAREYRQKYRQETDFSKYMYVPESKRIQRDKTEHHSYGIRSHEHSCEMINKYFRNFPQNQRK